MVNYYKKTTKILENNNCYFKRQGKGSHEMWFSPITNKSITVPVTSKSKHTYKAILKQAGIDNEDI